MIFRRYPLWLFLLLLSISVHVFVSWQIGRDMELALAVPDEHEVRVALEQSPPPQVLEPSPEDKHLEFEEEFDAVPPEILIAPQAVTPPPPNVLTALRADSGGISGVQLPGAIAALPFGEGEGTAGFGRGIGNALGNSTNRFAAYLQGLRTAGLDVVFVVDATGSMRWVLDEVKGRIRDISDTVRSLVPIARFGIVAYRDKDDPEFVTKVQPLTYSTAKLRRFLDGTAAGGGGDWFEAIDEGLRVAIEESGWRAGARRLIILVGDAPPANDSLPGIIRTAKLFGRSGGTISTLDVSGEANPALIEAVVGRKVSRDLYRNESMSQYQQIADAGGGDAATLDGETKLAKRLMILIMGDQFASHMRSLLEVI